MGTLYYTLIYKSGRTVYTHIHVDTVEHGLCMIFFVAGVLNSDSVTVRDLFKCIEYTFYKDFESNEDIKQGIINF